VVALIAPHGLVERNRSGVGFGNIQRAQHVGWRRVLAAAVHAQTPNQALRDDADQR